MSLKNVGERTGPQRKGDPFSSTANTEKVETFHLIQSLGTLLMARKCQ